MGFRPQVTNALRWTNELGVFRLVRQTLAKGTNGKPPFWFFDQDYQFIPCLEKHRGIQSCMAMVMTITSGR